MKPSAPRTRDAVLVVPGIMGSELIRASDQTMLWGVREARWYVSAWTTGGSLAELRLSDDERQGRYGRIVPGRLIEFPAFAPMLRALEPYTTLLAELGRIVVHQDAIATYPYDWRLPVAVTAAGLAGAVRRLRDGWRAHEAQREARRADPDDREAEVVVVAHSMGGLLARHLSLVPGATDGVRMTITLGTPFYGAVDAAMVLAIGRGGPLPLPRARLRTLAATLPGLHDLLPAYRCVDAGTEARRLSPEDVARLGGDRDLAQSAADWHARVAAVQPVGHVAVAGVHQPTPQSVTLRDGVPNAEHYTCRPLAGGGIKRVDLAGDGTVYRESAQLPGPPAVPFGQSHGALASTEEAIRAVADTILHRERGPWLGAGEIGMRAPDVVEPGSAIEIVISGIEHPRDASCRVVDVESGRQVAAPQIVAADGRWVARPVAPGPGLYRVQVTGGGFSGVTQLVMAAGADG